MKELTSNTGGRFLFFDDIEDLQESALGSAAAMYFGKGNFVISGCGVSGDTVEEGYVYLDGKIRKVEETDNLAFPVYMVPRNTTEQGMYLDSATEQDVSITYGVQFVQTAGDESIRFTSSGPESRVEQVLFANMELDGDMSLDNLNVAGSIFFKSRTTPSNIGEFYFDDDGFHASTGITTGTGVFSTGISSPLVTVGALGTGQISIPDTASAGLVLDKNSVSYGAGKMTMSASLATFSVPISAATSLTLTGSTNAVLSISSLEFGDSSILAWGVSGTRSYLRTEAQLSVVGLGEDSPLVSIQKRDDLATDAEYKIDITESSVMCYSPVTSDYPINRSGLDLLDGEARLYIHGHMYKVGVSAKGFLYDQNNPEFVDPVSGGDSSASIGILNNVSEINWKAVISDSTYTGKLSLTATGLHYDGNLRIGGSVDITGGLVVGTSVNAKDIYAETVRIKNDSAFVQGKAGVTTIYALHNLRFEIAQGASTSSRIIKLVADKVTCTYIGGILTATVTNSSQVLSGFSVPHEATIITQ